MLTFNRNYVVFFTIALTLISCSRGGKTVTVKTPASPDINTSSTFSVCSTPLTATLTRISPVGDIAADSIVTWRVSASGCATAYSLLGATTSASFISTLDYTRSYQSGVMIESVQVIGRDASGNIIGSAMVQSPSFTVGASAAAAISISLFANGAATATVDYNSPAVLSWSVTGADACTLTYPNINPISATSVLTGNLTATTVYTLSCTNTKGGAASKSVTVNVKPQFVVTLKANQSKTPAAVASGSYALLDWSAPSAVQCQFVPENVLVPTVGSRLVGPIKVATLFRIRCHNGSQETIDSVTVNVIDKPSVNLTVNGAKNITIDYGKSALLAWNTSSVTTCSLPKVSSTALAGAAVSTGKLTAPSNIFTLTCNDASGNSATESVEVKVNQNSLGNFNLMGLVGLFHFDEAAAPFASPSGTASASCGAYVSCASGNVSGGKLGGAATFNSSGLQLPATQAFVGTEAMTVAFWIKTTGTNARIITQREVSGFAGEYLLNLDAAGKVNYWDYDTTYRLNFTSQRAVNDGQWHHVALVKTAGSGKIYIDGTLDASQAKTSASLKNYQIYIGYDGRSAGLGQNPEYLNGSLDELVLIRREVLDFEILALYQLGN